MSVVKMTLCDNPHCNNSKIPESEKPYRPPYAWLTLKGGYFGCGPSISIEVCSAECVEQAMFEAFAQVDS